MCHFPDPSLLLYFPSVTPVPVDIKTQLPKYKICPCGRSPSDKTDKIVLSYIDLQVQEFYPSPCSRGKISGTNGHMHRGNESCYGWSDNVLN